MFKKKFVLASSSISRFKILKNCGLLFTKTTPLCDEERFKKELIRKKTSPKQMSLELARIKSQSVSSTKKNKLVVGSDTTISFNGKLLNKAKNLKDAKKKILLMAGKSHHIYSSVSVYYNNKEVWNNTQKTLVKIRTVTKKEAEEYLLKSGKQILNSVGCYQLEGFGPNIIGEIKGDSFNVMGFPLFPFLTFLKRYNTKKQKL